MKVCACGSKEFNHVKTYTVPSGDICIVLCKQCGLMRDISDYVSYDRFYTPEAGLYGPAVVSLETYLLNTDAKQYLDFIARYLIDEGRMLDIGCGSGFLVEWFQRRRWDAVGLDPNVTSVQFGISRGLKLSAGKLDEVELPDNHFDLITVIHVLEHLPNLYDSLRRILGLLKEDGLLFIVVPNFGSKTYKAIYCEKNFIVTPGTHIWYFTKETLQRTCKQVGFRLIKCSTGLPSLELPIDAGVPRKITKWIFRQWCRLWNDGNTIMALFQKHSGYS